MSYTDAGRFISVHFSLISLIACRIFSKLIFKRMNRILIVKIGERKVNFLSWKFLYPRILYLRRDKLAKQGLFQEILLYLEWNRSGNVECCIHFSFFFLFLFFFHKKLLYFIYNICIFFLNFFGFV